MIARCHPVLLFVAHFAFASCGSEAQGLGPALVDLQGAMHAPLQRARGAVHVVLFVSQECPIANSYAPTLRSLAARWQGQPVRLFVVHVDPDLTASAARQHALDYELPGTVLLDPKHELATVLGATRTPEAFVLADAGVVYHGRIDDQWAALGSRAAVPQVHDLRDAVDAVLAGKPIAVAETQAIGCLLPEAKR